MRFPDPQQAEEAKIRRVINKDGYSGRACRNGKITANTSILFQYHKRGWDDGYRDKVADSKLRKEDSTKVDGYIRRLNRWNNRSWIGRSGYCRSRIHL